MPPPNSLCEAVSPTAAPTPTRPIRILRLGQVLDVTGLGKTKIYELQSEGRFPMRIQITPHSVGWIEEEVQAWLAKRVAVSASLLRRGDRVLFNSRR